jgi:hypothetical protein
VDALAEELGKEEVLGLLEDVAADSLGYARRWKE